MILVIRLRGAHKISSPSCPARHGTVEIGLIMGARPVRGVGWAASLVMSPRSVVAQMAEAPGINAPDWGEGIE